MAVLFPVSLGARKFYDDDPIRKEPPPLSAANASPQELSDYFDYFLQTFGKPGEGQPKKEEKQKGAKWIPAQAVNTMGEVPDSAWFTNRMGSRPMSIEELVRGPRRDNAPSKKGPWKVIAAKTEGITPGFTIEDEEGRVYLLKFDPLTNPEMTTAADAVGSVFFHALGYNVPENYVVTFDQERLEIKEGTKIKTPKGEDRLMEDLDIIEILRRVPRDSRGQIRGLASYLLEGKPLGGFRFHGTRPDDPNDIARHEHRRDLRGLFVFCAWLGHDDSRAINTLDMLVEENGVKYIKHHLVDFGSILGSATIYANSPRSGNEYMFEFKPAAVQVITLGALVPPWARLDYKEFPSVGLFDYRIFDPEKWKPEYRNPAFANRLPDDTYWAAKKVMAFSDEQIRAMVGVGEYSNPEAEAWLVKCLIERRHAIGRSYFAKVLPLDHFRVVNGRLEFDDLAVQYGFAAHRDFHVRWSRFDNESETHTPIGGAGKFTLPAEAGNGGGSFFAARIWGDDEQKSVTVYLRGSRGEYKVIGIDHAW